MEMRFYRDVILPYMGSGDIVQCEMQKPYELQPKFKRKNKTVNAIKYVSDFYVVTKSGAEIIIDIKGQPDSVAKLKRKLMFFKYPDIDYRWITYSKIDGGWTDYETVKKARSERKKQKEIQNGKT